MSMSLSDFNSFTTQIINLVVQLFSVLDSAVIIDIPRFSLFNFMISVIFLTLMIEVINWLRGAHGSGGSKWDYIMRNPPEQKYEVFHESMDEQHLQAKGFSNEMISYGKRER
jgi:hypothetical protein